MNEKWADRIYYGGDYNPDQWDEATIAEDMRLFKKAGINLVTLPVFSWAKLEPKEGIYEFAWLDKLMDQFQENNIKVCLATPTVAQPAWLSTKYPEVLPVDIAGRKRTHGMRVFFCYNSEKYRERAAAIAEAMAVRYGSHPALAIWHVANEYGTYCYCDHCQDKFRDWLFYRYGSIEGLNDHWHTSFWGRTVYSFAEITLPTELNDDYRFNPSIQLDYMRFVTASTAECFLNEADILRKHCPDIPIQTNMSGYIKKLDQFEMTKHMDLVGFDNYPSPTHERSFVAMKLDLMRGLKGGRSFMLAEQSPNQQNWQPYNKLKRPGEVRRLSYQALAHGADTCLFFQLRQSIAGQEKFHGAVIAHSGKEDTRIFKECSTMGAEFQKLGDSFIGARTPSKVAVVFDWNTWWALENCSGPTKDMEYLESVHRFYQPFYEKNVSVDIINTASTMDGYDIIVCPMLYMMKDGVDEKLKTFVKEGGTLIGTVMTGVADENDRCVYGAYPGPLKEVFGIWVEETDALYPQEQNTLKLIDSQYEKTEYKTEFLCDRIRTEGASVQAVYGEDFYEGEAAITVNVYGKGKAYYVGSFPEAAYLKALADEVCGDKQITSLFSAGEGMEITRRCTKEREIYFAINHSETESYLDLSGETLTNMLTDQEVSGILKVAAGDVVILGK